MRKGFALIRVAAGIAQDHLVFLAGDGVAMLLHIEVDGALDLFAGRGLLAGHRYDEPDLHRFLRKRRACEQRRRQGRGNAFERHWVSPFPIGVVPRGSRVLRFPGGTASPCSLGSVILNMRDVSPPALDWFIRPWSLNEVKRARTRFVCYGPPRPSVWIWCEPARATTTHVEQAGATDLRASR